MLSSKMLTSAPVSMSAWIFEFVFPIRTSAVLWLLERVWMAWRDSPFIVLTVEIPFVCFMQTAAKWPFSHKNYRRHLCCTVLTSVADGPITASAAYNFVGIEVGSLFHKSFPFLGLVRIFPPFFSNFIDHFLAFQCQHTQFEKRS